jgi:hypothetical protein
VFALFEFLPNLGKDLQAARYRSLVTPLFDRQPPFDCWSRTSCDAAKWWLWSFPNSRSSIPSKKALIDENAAWEDDRNVNHARADWQFTTADARIKLKYLYPSI